MTHDEAYDAECRQLFECRSPLEVSTAAGGWEPCDATLTEAVYAGGDDRRAIVLGSGLPMSDGRRVRYVTPR